MNHIDVTVQRHISASRQTQLDSNKVAPSTAHKSVETTTSAAVTISNKKQSKQNISLQTQQEIQQQIKKLNESIGPLSTFIKFGVDKNDVFFVSVIDKKNNEVISRFPAAKAENIIQKLKEPIGIIFDTKG